MDAALTIPSFPPVIFSQVDVISLTGPAAAQAMRRGLSFKTKYAYLRTTWPTHVHEDKQTYMPCPSQYASLRAVPAHIFTQTSLHPSKFASNASPSNAQPSTCTNSSHTRHLSTDGSWSELRSSCTTGLAACYIPF